MRAHRRGQRVRGSTVVRVGEPSMKAWYMPNAPAHAVTFEVAHLVIDVGMGINYLPHYFLRYHDVRHLTELIHLTTFKD